ncbi:MAG TPA: phage holin family protein [Chryseosolibacter sp.]
MSEFFYKAAGVLVAPFRYAEREAKALKEHVKEDIQAYVAVVLKLAAAGLAALLFLFFISIAVANWINQGMHSQIAGFAIVAAFYLLVAVVMYVLKLADDKKKKAAENHKRVMEGHAAHA